MTAKKRSSKPRVVGDGDLGMGFEATYGDGFGGYGRPSASSPIEPEVEPLLTAEEWRQRVARAEAELLAFARRSALFGSFDVIERFEREEAVREARAGLEAAEEHERERPPAAQKKPGPDPSATVTRAQIEAKRAELAAQGKPHGYDSLARALSVHRDTIRRRLKGGTTPN